MAEAQLIQEASQATQLAPSRNPTESEPNRPIEPLQLEEESVPNVDNTVYPTGAKLWLSLTSLILSQFLVGLDMTIVAVAVPSLTNQFHTLSDLGWYSSAYQIIFSSFTFFSAKLYTVFPAKTLFLGSIALFEAGSLLCAVAPTSFLFILGRAIAGLGSSGLGIGTFVILNHSFPLVKRPLFGGILGAMGSLGLVIAPALGGALIDAFNWRACFGINIPLGVLTFIFTLYGFIGPADPNEDEGLPLLEKIKRLDLLGTLLFVPGIISLLLALQWGGNTYGWKNARIIVLIGLFAALIAGFAYLQYRRQDKATLPPRIFKQRSIIAAAWFNACVNGVLAITEYYLSIYWQGVRGMSAAKSGALGLPLFGGLLVSIPLMGSMTTVIGYYYPFMIATSILAPIASGLLTTLDLDDSTLKVIFLLVFLGVAIGLGIQGPIVAVQTVLPTKDVGTGVALTGLAGGLGSALSISSSATLFQNRLYKEVATYAPGTNTTSFAHGGLNDVRDYIGANRLKDVLLGYDKAVMQTMYMPVALAVVSIVGSLAMERKSVKKKQR